MDPADFKTKLDNREFWGVNDGEMWEAAREWEKLSNTEDAICQWSWDCGLKLDYDGDICRLSSRFYPPHKSSASYGKYHGTISVMIGDEYIHGHEVEAESLDILKTTVENYVSTILERIRANIKAAF